MINEIDKPNDKFSCSIVWTPLPLISALFPFIGHAGICASDGTIHNYAGSFYVQVGKMIFGAPTKYVKLKVENLIEWDSHINLGDEKYKGEKYNFLANNCHDYVAFILNSNNFQGIHWNSTKLCCLFISKGRYVSCISFVKTYAQFAVVIILIFLIIFFSAGGYIK
ncbi:unnamed protein product [Blepharisma stoltei]|uniref:Uncharacterized protein n=1 Tax=Blepharisma stoltei TaxID=1481888 RepID=A0AAU9IBH1_9CILI|nr:unnamed protein product [Blepharisma stoltei]